MRVYLVASFVVVAMGSYVCGQEQPEDLAPSFQSWWNGMLEVYCRENENAGELDACLGFLDGLDGAGNTDDGPPDNDGGGSEDSDSSDSDKQDNPPVEPCSYFDDANGDRCLAAALQAYYTEDSLRRLSRQELWGLAVEILSSEELKTLLPPSESGRESLQLPDPSNTNGAQ